MRKVKGQYEDAANAWRKRDEEGEEGEVDDKENAVTRARSMSKLAEALTADMPEGEKAKILEKLN